MSKIGYRARSFVLFNLALLLLLLLGSCGGDASNKASAKATLAEKNSSIDLTLTGEELFVKNCKLCHGINGQLQLNGAKDLRESVMTLTEREILIKDGKNAMTAFKKLLSEEEIRKVAEYTLSFKKDE